MDTEIGVCEKCNGELWYLAISNKVSCNTCDYEIEDAI